MKRIVICADGTWNEREQVDDKTGKRKPSNVTKVARTVLPKSAGGVDQIVYYHEGVGTEGGLDKFTGGAFGKGMEENIRNLYRFIVYNYDPGDELYFFGFSRGAFTVRSLAGFMNKVGLLEKDDDFYTPEVYGLYEHNHAKGSPAWEKAFHNIRGTRPCPTIRFIGVWDTVGALGAPGAVGQWLNPRKYQYHDIGLHPTISNAIHALAIDEQRKPFAPSLWTRPNGWLGNLEQAWFPGVHTNVGGGYHPDGVANEPLHWIVEKAEAVGLEFDKPVLARYLPCFNSSLRDSMKPWYQVFGDHKRPIGKHAADGEAVHQAALDRRQHFPRYRPTNLEAFLGAAGSNPKIATTTRVPRGTPCPELDGKHD
jgi:uncharacterized protein (DUF2235 family)